MPAPPRAPRTLSVARALALVILAGAAWWHLDHRRPASVGLDGAYYYQMARHVADGDGLVTSVSLYHQALEPLPSRTNIYPLWPLTLGAFGRVLGMPSAAVWLPFLLYWLDVLLVYVLAARICGRAGLHAIALAAPLYLAVHPPFFFATVLPYTEGLAMLGIVGALLAVDLSATCEGQGRRLWWSTVAGLAVGLAYATRYQMIFAVGGLWFVGWRRPRRGLSLACSAAGLALPVLGVLASLSWLPDLSPRDLLIVRDHSAGVPALDVLVETHGWLDFVRDRLDGLRVAFDPGDANSYVHAFGWTALLLLAALTALLVTPVRRRFLDALRQRSDCAAASATLVTGIALLLPVHLLHQRIWQEWLFGWRHGVAFIFVLVPAVVGLIALVPRRFRAAAEWTSLAVIVLSLVPIASRAQSLVSGPAAPNPALVEIGAWLDARQEPPTVLAVDPQLLAVHSRARFHWAGCLDDSGYLDVLLRRARIDYVLLRRAELDCPAFAPIRQRVHLITVVSDVGVFQLK